MTRETLDKLSSSTRVIKPIPKKDIKHNIDFDTATKSLEDEYKEVKHTYIDLDSVKKDDNYELFLIRKEDGSSFYNSRLLRSMKMVSDFRKYFEEKQTYLPFENEILWTDKIYFHAAREIFYNLGKDLDRFFRFIRNSNEGKLAVLLDKALFALMLCSNERNLMIHKPIKSCSEYFFDFQKLFRAFLHTSIYHHWLALNPEEDNEEIHEILHIVHSICKTLFLHLKSLSDMKLVVHDIIKEAIAFAPREYQEILNGGEFLGYRLYAEYAAMQKFLLKNGRGPVLKVFESLEIHPYSVFDPLMEQNLPSLLFDCCFDEKKVSFLHIPSPTTQEFIDHAEVSEEFKSMLMSLEEDSKIHKHLLINLQDRTSWKEHARSSALEDLSEDPLYEHVIDCATLSVDTDFYYQVEPYNKINDAKQFKAQFKEILLDESTGYLFPQSVGRTELALFIDKCLTAIHHLFFSSKNVLTLANRCQFIDIFYLLLVLKLVEWLKPSTVSLTCKDGIDKGNSLSAALFIFLKLINEVGLSEEDWTHLNGLIYGFSLLVRDRSILPDRFARMGETIKVIDNARHEAGELLFIDAVKEELGPLFDTDILRAKIQFE